jgi:hypothetical protein
VPPIRSLFLLALAAATLVACDEPAPRRRAEPPAPAASAPAVPAASVERAGAVVWDAAKGAFLLNGKLLKPARLWTFDGSTDGWTGLGATLVPATGGGLAVNNVAFDPILVSPSGLAIDGAHNPLVVIRLTRVKAGGDWSGTLFYVTPQHGTAEAFHGRPADLKDIAVNETVTLVYDMSRPAAGGEDWSASTIDQLRFDTDDQAGGQFVIHQVAIADNPDPAVPLGGKL